MNRKIYTFCLFCEERSLRKNLKIAKLELIQLKKQKWLEISDDSMIEESENQLDLTENSSPIMSPSQKRITSFNLNKPNRRIKIPQKTNDITLILT